MSDPTPVTDGLPLGLRPGDELHGTRFAIVPEWLLDEAPPVVKLYAVLDRYANGDRQAWPGQATLAERMEVSDRTIRTLLKRLQEIGALREEKRRWNGTTVYTLLPVRPETSFRSEGNDRKPASAQTGNQLPPNESHERKPRRKLVELPETFVVTAEMQRWARQNTPSVDLAFETEAFKDYHRAKGSTFRDWTAAWQTWMRNAVKFSAGRNGSPKQASSDAYEPMPHYDPDTGTFRYGDWDPVTQSFRDKVK